MTNGERIKYLREKNGFTQKDIATRLGVEHERAKYRSYKKISYNF